ncbi:MAG: hypothetical protein K8F54_05115 [Altibacter sp.]|uniref:hypothetical protein n=1 Tax=Altibacter sp. TaxID=2024823 RepID=UPI001D5417A1|nr:hypothetical protein [Altibacter sp.]MBZ0326963.1 hypothetical protein [Altibacter sp.]
MTKTEQHLLTLLKKDIVRTFLENNFAPEDMSEWKGEAIVAFQEDLFSKTKARVSEKWFYTYLKKKPKKLPRIDMLNLLSSYAGYTNWNNYEAAHLQKVGAIKKTGALKKYGWMLVLIPLVVLIVGNLNSENEFHFCMIDEDKGEAITNIPLDIKILSLDQSPIYLKTDTTGCFSFMTKEETIRFVVQSPYHKTDTIVRHINSNSNANVQLATDNYALMLQYYSNGNVEDWKKRKEQLNNLIADDAQIYQVFQKHSGIELYSKQDFIGKMTIPTSSLKNIDILDKHYKDGKIVKLKFMVK